KLLYFKMRFSSLSNLYMNINEISFSALDKYQIINFLQNSTAIVDIQHPDNFGLTMRSLEVLGLKRKLITTNSDVINYDFYDKNNVYVIDRKNPKIDRVFFETPYTQIPEIIYNKYSIDFWINDIFNA